MSLDNILLIPGVGGGKSPLDEIRDLLFTGGKKGAMWIVGPKTVWADTAGTVAITSGTAAARIDDYSGNGHHATQATAGDRPLYQTDDGLYLLADGVDDKLVSSAIDFSATNQITSFAALRKFSDATRAVYMWQRSAASTFSSSVSFEAPNANTANNYRYGVNFGTITGATATAIAPVSSVLCGIADGVNDYIDLRLNGVSNRVDIDLGAGFATNQPFGLFHRAGVNDLHFNGRGYAWIVVEGVVPTSTIERVETLLAALMPGVSL